MIKPTKHQSLSDNVLVIGADIMFAIRNGELSVEEVYQRIKIDHNVKLTTVLDSLTFLWMLNAVEVVNGTVKKL